MVQWLKRFGAVAEPPPARLTCIECVRVIIFAGRAEAGQAIIRDFQNKSTVHHTIRWLQISMVANVAVVEIVHSLVERSIKSSIVGYSLSLSLSLSLWNYCQFLWEGGRRALSVLMYSKFCGNGESNIPQSFTSCYLFLITSLCHLTLYNGNIYCSFIHRTVQKKTFLCMFLCLTLIFPVLVKPWQPRHFSCLSKAQKTTYLTLESNPFYMKPSDKSMPLSSLWLRGFVYSAVWPPHTLTMSLINE